MLKVFFLSVDLLQYFEDSAHEDFTRSHPGLVCNCFFNCRSWSYSIKVHTRDLQPYELWETNDTLLLDVNFSRDYITVYKTDLVYTWVDLLCKYKKVA